MPTGTCIACSKDEVKELNKELYKRPGVSETMDPATLALHAELKRSSAILRSLESRMTPQQQAEARGLYEEKVRRAQERKMLRVTSQHDRSGHCDNGI